MKNLFVALLLTLFWFNIPAATLFNQNCREAYEHILCLRFGKAWEKIDAEKNIHPDNTLPHLLENTVNFLSYMISEEEQHFAILIDKRDDRLQRLASGDHTSPWFLYSQAEIYFQLGFVRMKSGEYLTAGLDLNRAYRLLEENQKKFPAFLPNLVRLGLLHAMFGAIPDKYRWAFNAFDIRGSVQTGLKELNLAMTSCFQDETYSFLLPETAFILSFVSLNMTADKKDAFKLIAEFKKPAMIRWMKQSPLMSFCLANLRLKTGSNDEAINILTSITKDSESFPFHYPDYILGISRLNRLDRDAHLPLLSFVARFKGSNYLRSAYERLAWYYFIQDDTAKYNLYMDRIPLRGGNLIDSDKQALSNSKNKIIPNLHLLKARLLFDGGYYQRSMEMLSGFSRSNVSSAPALHLEYIYRMARVYDEWNRKEDAIKWYDLTIREGSSRNSWHAANACLHLGLIYENQGKFDLARKNYEKCLNLKFEEYHFSITQKAKAGLIRIKKR